MKIIDKINKAIADGNPFFSFEFFPPRTDEGVENLFERLDRMASYGPTFCDITWGAGGTTADVTLDIATRMQNMVRRNAHLPLVDNARRVKQGNAACGLDLACLHGLPCRSVWRP